jgi:hypothetical protein
MGDRVSDINRTRNMAEELHREFTRLGFGTTSDPASMTTEFQVNVESKRNLGEAAKLVRDVLRRHYMEEDVEIEKVQEGPDRSQPADYQ